MEGYKLKKTVITVSLVLLVILAIFSFERYNVQNSKKTSSKTNNSSSQINPQAVKVKAVDFTLKNLQGEEISLSSLKGKKIMLNFFATWCGPCKTEMPDMQKLHEETKDSNLIILAVNLGESEAVVKSFMQNNKYSFPVLLDTKGTLSGKYNVSAIPTTYFIDKEGNIIPFQDIVLNKTVTRKQGAMSLEEMRSYIKNLDS
jgi:peroxiredoxin